MPKTHQNKFIGRALPDLLGELMRAPDPLAAMGATSKGEGKRGKGEEGRGPSSLAGLLPQIRHHTAAAVNPAAAGLLLLWARRTGDIDRLLHGRRSAANASSVSLSADAGS